MGLTVKIDEKLAAALLKKYPLSARTLKHVQDVKRRALAIADKIIAHGHRVNTDFLTAAALLHDVGRVKITEDMPNNLQPLHFSEGAAILVREGYPELATIAAGHTLPFVNAADAKTLGLPKPIVLPDSLEAKIICIADKIKGDVAPEDEVAAFWIKHANTYFAGRPELKEKTIRLTERMLTELRQLGWNGKIE